MEADKNPFPQLDLFPRITRVCHFIFDHITDPGLSDHNTGGGPALDRALYDDPNQLEFTWTYPEVPDGVHE